MEQAPAPVPTVPAVDAVADPVATKLANDHFQRLVAGGMDRNEALKLAAETVQQLLAEQPEPAPEPLDLPEELQEQASDGSAELLAYYTAILDSQRDPELLASDPNRLRRAAAVVAAPVRPFSSWAAKAL